jgi:acyl-CoA thioester hydrolase
MARVKLKFPDENPLHTAIIPVRIGDVNYGGHVGNDSLLTIVHEARMQMLCSHGYNEINAGGNSMIMADVMIAYKGESFYGDKLIIKMYADEIKEHSFDLLYHITARRNNIETDIAHVKTGMVCFDFKLRKVATMTNELQQFLSNVKI